MPVWMSSNPIAWYLIISSGMFKPIEHDNMQAFVKDYETKMKEKKIPKDTSTVGIDLLVKDENDDEK